MQKAKLLRKCRKERRGKEKAGQEKAVPHKRVVSPQSLATCHAPNLELCGNENHWSGKVC